MTSFTMRSPLSRTLEVGAAYMEIFEAWDERGSPITVYRNCEVMRLMILMVMAVVASCLDASLDCRMEKSHNLDLNRWE
jgi:hypothetical protein